MAKGRPSGGGELEGAVMEALWIQEGWLSPGEVHEIVGRSRVLAYNTVLTVLVRLVEKGRLDRRRQGRAHVYQPLQTREQYAASRMEQVLAEASDRPVALAKFVEVLDPDAREQLHRLLDEIARRD